MAWREKVAIFMMIVGMCGIVVFYIIVFGMLLCPDSDKAWNPTELSQHAGLDDYYAAIAGKVYDVGAPRDQADDSLPTFTKATTATYRPILPLPPSCSSLPGWI